MTVSQDLIDRIETALDSVRDYLRSDGGDVRLHKVREDLVVELQLLGSCESCSMSNMTMRAGLEQAIRKVAPEVVKVEAINA